MSPTKIEWADESWNPVTGCTKVSAGCANCYAERMVKRFGDRVHGFIEGYDEGEGVGWRDVAPFSHILLHPERLDRPLHWRKPRRVFVCSMGDLFHEDVPDLFIMSVLNVCDRAAEERGHIFLILTKRQKRMRELMGRWWEHVRAGGVEPRMDRIWLGVSVEEQATADERIPLLLQTPAAVRFVSVEPMLGAVRVDRYFNGWCPYCGSDLVYYNKCESCHRVYPKKLRPVYANCAPSGHPDDGWIPPLHWIICGGESGPGARPMGIEWARSLRDQCQAASVPFFLKQIRVDGKLVKEPELDGQQHLEYPA